ncbi:hypothetical protein BJV78DRAFT_469382 [Lactifluus subvellereus]|nr:hypothetical protein BJV78DRAFT_469382 [Lactifluus subvellereus]
MKNSLPQSGTVKMQVTRSSSQGHLVTTYAHKRGRSRLFHASSSPIKATDCEDLTLAEMTRRMKKRARQSISSPHTVHEGFTDSQKFLKRAKNAHAIAPTLAPDPDRTCSSSVFPLDTLTSLNDGTNNLQYQTPFNLSPVSSPTAPDSMSPVPPSRRQLSRTGSRNLKENKGIKCLASPFHSGSVSRACSASGSRANSPKKKAKRPPFYVKARTRSEANANPGENVSDQVLFPASGSLPTLGSMKSAACDRHLANSSTAYMLQNLSGQDWFKPAKALSHSPFSEDYVPPGTPFQEWDYSSEAFFDGVPLQTSTPIVVKDSVRGHVDPNGKLSTPDSIHALDNNTMNSCNMERLESRRRTLQHFDHDSIFSSSLDASTTLSSISQSNCMHPESTLQGHSASLPCPYLPDSGQAVTNLSGMLDSLDIDGMKNSPVSLVQRSRSLDSATNTAILHPSSSIHQTAGRRRDRASTIRASDYMVKPAIVVPCGGETSTAVTALTTRTRSGTIRPARPPVVPLASGSLGAKPHPPAEQGQAHSSTLSDLLISDKKLFDSPGSSQSKPTQTTRVSEAQVMSVEGMDIDVHHDESDDELLLDRKGWNWDGRWD